MLPKSATNALKDMYTLGDRLKQFESIHSSIIPNNSPFIVRLDGVAFSTLTRGLVRPFDWRLMQAMMETTRDLLVKFNCTMAYTQSDEISLVFDAANNDALEKKRSMDDVASEDTWRALKLLKTTHGSIDKTMESIAVESVSVESVQAQKNTGETVSGEKEDKNEKKKNEKGKKIHLYAGRSDKIISTLASYASARLNYHLSTKPFPPHLHIVGIAYFDARIVQCGKKDAVLGIWWRSGFDGLRNAVGIVTRACLLRQETETLQYEDSSQWKPEWKKYNYPIVNSSPSVLRKIQKKVTGLTVAQSLDLLSHLSSNHFPNGISILGPDAIVPPRFLWGVFMKKEKYELKDCIDPRTQKPIDSVWRTRVRFGSWNWGDWTESERVEFLFSKFWPKTVQEVEKMGSAGDGIPKWNMERVPVMDALDVLD
jgi:tRNA(His) guanylyltransferase